LWPEGTFVNYDANVNTTVNKLRLVLGDSPDQPAYIETIPRLGYCFVGSVERKNELPKSVAQAVAAVKREGAELRSPVEPANGVLPVLNAAESAAVFWSSSRTKVWAGVVLLCGMLIGMGIVLLAHRA
jgi:DNA-binding winged helix-turn-helix (wHTH) protein